ncbi:hypothetical protein MMC28_003300 [Mycoblastus sanguinarius]|nr:hypothetical protein [Mycoblastus sanguinarius]
MEKSDVHQAPSSSTRLVSVPSPKRTSADMAADPPPAYSTAMNRSKFTQNADDPTNGHSPDRYVRLCPHQKLSFERFNYIARLRNIKTAKKLDAFTKLSTSHHEIVNSGDRVCLTKPGDLMKPYGYSVFKYTSGNEKPGFNLRANWHLRFDESKKQHITRLLEKPNIWLCAHTHLSDPWIVDAVFEALHPGESYDDPVEAYEARQSNADQNKKHCDRCDTLFTVYRSARGRAIQVDEVWVTAERFLGEGESEKDPIWGEQCALARNEESLSYWTSISSQCLIQ